MGHSWLTNGYRLCLCREFREYRMDTAISQCAQVAHFHSPGEQGISHYWAVSSQLLHAGKHLDIRAFPRRGQHSVSKVGNGIYWRKIGSKPCALIHAGNNFIHKAIQPHQYIFAGSIAAFL